MNEQNVPFASLLLVEPKMDAVVAGGTRRRGLFQGRRHGGVLPKTN